MQVEKANIVLGLVLLKPVGWMDGQMSGWTDEWTVIPAVSKLWIWDPLGCDPIFCVCAKCHKLMQSL